MKGFIALITIFIILAITLIMGVSFSLLSADESAMALENFQSSKAYFLSNLCAEQALMKLKENSNYSGNETINIENGSCQILPIEGQWIVKTTGNFQNQIKKIRISISQVNPGMVIDSWQEVASF
jgi:predicted chitinase